MPVKWDQQHWLIPSDQLTLFAYAVNFGSNEEFESFFLKTEDYNKSNKGMPDLPKEYEKYLNAKPIKAKVSAVGAIVDDWYPALTLNVGEADGVVKGMKFWLIGVMLIVFAGILYWADHLEGRRSLDTFGAGVVASSARASADQAPASSALTTPSIGR